MSGDVVSRETPRRSDICPRCGGQGFTRVPFGGEEDCGHPRCRAGSLTEAELLLAYGVDCDSAPRAPSTVARVIHRSSTDDPQASRQIIDANGAGDGVAAMPTAAKRGAHQDGGP